MIKVYNNMVNEFNQVVFQLIFKFQVNKMRYNNCKNSCRYTLTKLKFMNCWL